MTVPPKKRRDMPVYSTDKRFTGKIWDEVSALLYFGARYYDPELGRFITADPTIAHPFDPQDLNRYSYCRNNPVNYIDPTGYSWWSKFWNWITGGIGAIIAAVAIIAVTAVANVFTGGALTPVLMGEIFGAIGGAAGAAATGGDIGRGMLIGTVVGGITGGMSPPGAASGGETTTEFVTTGINDAMRWGIEASSNEIVRQSASFATVAAQSIITSGVGAGAGVINRVISNATASGKSLVNNYVYNPEIGLDTIGINGQFSKTGWLPKAFEVFVPGYGNYGGPIRNGPEPPINLLDAVCERHDAGYRAEAINRADESLIVDMRRLPIDPRYWGDKDTSFVHTVYGAIYRGGAITAFSIRLNWAKNHYGKK